MRLPPPSDLFDFQSSHESVQFGSRKKTHWTKTNRSEEIAQWKRLARKCQFRPSRLASFCKVSLRTLQRHFARNYGATVGEWLTHVRMHEALIALTEAESIKEVASSSDTRSLQLFQRFQKVSRLLPGHGLLQQDASLRADLHSNRERKSGRTSLRDLTR